MVYKAQGKPVKVHLLLDLIGFLRRLPGGAG
jgi:hypothetical protein